MNPALWPRDLPLSGRLIRVDPQSGATARLPLEGLPRLLEPADLLVVNDSATLPASLQGRTARGEAIELRLAAVPSGDSWPAVIFGDGNWRTRTEDRAPPPRLAIGDELVFADGLRGTILSFAIEHPRLMHVRFDRSGAGLWRALYRAGRPVQYAHLAGALELWHVQTPYAARPWSVEAPSAGLPLIWRLLEACLARGVQLAWLTHGAGLSSTGDPGLDIALPLPERFDIPEATVAAIAAARERGGRVVAVGTTVTRALEGCAALHGGQLVAGEGVTDLILTAAHRLRVVDGILTGLHEAGASHLRLLEAFAPDETLRRAGAEAERNGFLSHEFGDSMLVLNG